jgi:uncharacterized membrane protein YqiK
MVPVVPEGKAMVLYGRKMAPGVMVGYRVITEGGRSPIPIIEAYEMMDLGPQKVEIDLRDIVVTSDGVDGKAGVRLTATVRIPKKERYLNVAAENLLHVNFSDVRRWAKQFIEAHLRGYLRMTPFERATSDPLGTAAAIQSMVERDLTNIGVSVEGLTIHEMKPRDG